LPTHLYCLIPSAAHRRDLVPARGVDNVAVRALDAGEFIAWASTIDGHALSRDRVAIEQIVRTHDAVITAAVRAGVTVIPSPVTRPYASDTECIAETADRAAEIQELAVLAEGNVEMALLLTPSSTPLQSRVVPAGAGPGRRYLEGAREGTLAGDDGVTNASARILSAAVANLVRAESRRDPGARDEGPTATIRGLAISHLVQREGVASYRAAASSALLPGTIRLVIDGPRAPYSFAAFVPRGTILAP
jgi:Gas vesicle synthesis protein GvpL/GvpF